MSRFVHGIVVAAAPILIALIDTIAVPAVASPDCMTQNEARKAFPGDHIYWHGPKRCWDNVGKSRSQKPAATADANAASAPGASAPPAQTGKTSESAQRADTNKPSAPAADPVPVPFIGNDPSGVASWSAPAAPARAQQEEPQPAPAAAAKAEDANVGIGAPNAAPGSPDYLLEHCCWPPTLSEAPREDASLRNMVIASAGACGLAVGLWLFIYRRRRPARVALSPSLQPGNPLQHGGALSGAPRAPSRAERTYSEYQVSPAALRTPTRLRASADKLEGVS